jgi:magnesium-transporting ATPase (P-type)
MTEKNNKILNFIKIHRWKIFWIGFFLLWFIGLIFPKGTNTGGIQILLFIFILTILGIGIGLNNKDPKVVKQNKSKDKKKWFSWGWFFFWLIFGGGIGGIIYLIIKLGDKPK